MKFYDIKKVKHTLRKHIYHKKTDGPHREPIPAFITFGISFFGSVFIFLPILIGLIALGFFEVKYHDKFYPGVLIAGEKVGGMTYDEAFVHFQDKSEDLKKNGITVEFESLTGVKKVVNVPVSTSGLTADNSIEYFTINGWEKDLQKAYKFGRNINIFKTVFQQATLVVTNKNFDFSTTVQKEAVSSLLEGELSNFLKKSKSAEFSFVKNKINISKEQIGEFVNEEEVLNLIIKKISQLDTSILNIKTVQDMSVVKQEDLKKFSDFVENFGKKTDLVFKYKGYKWYIKGSKLVTWLTVKMKETGELGINQEKLEVYFKENVNRLIENPPKNSRFKIQNGELVEIVSGKAGEVINVEKVISEIEKVILEAKNNLNLESKIVNIQIETIQVEPKITKDIISKYQIKDLVGEVTTTFYGSSVDRAYNIKIGVDTINGMLIAPGEEFSTINAIGRVSEKEGYRKETVIKENKTAKEFGGGLCQVATTLFRLALHSGLPITERINHRFVVHYYDPAGLDAAIYGPHPDLRFVNDTGSYLLLQARVEGQKVIMELYGRKDGRTVEISEPTMYNRIPAPAAKYIQTRDLYSGQTKCTESPHDGLTTDVTYTVNYPDGIIKQRNFRSIYQPWQKVCLIGIN
jgi:vancomycin resistance protein YoaR